MTIGESAPIDERLRSERQQLEQTMLRQGGDSWVKDLGAMIEHTLLLSGLMLRFIVRYAWVIFRARVLERPIPDAQLVALNRRTASEYVRAAMKLKGGMIKMGQFVSARADVVPRELVEILGQLQDRVEPAPYEYVARTIEEQLKKPVEQVFASFDKTAVAAASFGQVHKAITKEGDAVVVKVLHRDIERSLKVDLAIFRVAVFFFGRLFPTFMLDRIYDEIVLVTLAELDYAREAKSAERVKKNLANDKRVRVPTVHWEYCRARMLCLEDITGLRIDDPKLIKEHGAVPREVLRAVIGAFCQQIYVDGFFQSDPHPGNLFFYPPDPQKPDAPLIGIIDFGQAKEMPKEFHAALRRAVTAVIQKDADGFLAAIVEMGVVEDAEIHKVRHVVLNLGAQIKDGTLREVMALDYEALAKDVLRALRDLEAFSVPNDLVLYGRTLGILQGLTYRLDKDLPIFEVAAPYLLEFAFGKR
jgi:predicted unusual protein kinase regulating ubiquinone biosynthesis (AarF/ABC1/UbiB family)